jgi:hypothetical protein
MGSVRIALVLALALVAVALGVVLSGSPPTVTRAAPLADFTKLSGAGGPVRLCQGGEVLPRGSSAVRISLEALIGPPVALTASSGGHVLATGRRGAGWSTGSVTIPVRPLARSYSNVTVCAQLGQPRKQPVNVDGIPTPPAQATHASTGQSAGGRMIVEYLRPGDTSWWSLVRSVARRMGLGHAFDGAWVALLAAAMMAALAALMSWVLVRELG